MTDILVDNPPKKGISRRHLLQGLTALTVSAGALIVGINNLPDTQDEKDKGLQKQHNQEQRDAYLKIIDSKTRKANFQVAVDNSHVRDLPRTNQPSQDVGSSHIKEKLPLNTRIRNGIYVEGNDPNNIKDANAKSSWIAFIRNNSEVGFIWGQNIKELPAKNYSK